jgi:hypothetical protein
VSSVRIEFSPDALEQIRVVHDWWRIHRPAAPEFLLVQGHFDGSLDECMKAYEGFEQHRFSQRTLEAPPIIENNMLCELANMSLAQNRPQDLSLLIYLAIAEAADEETVQEMLRKARTQLLALDHDGIFTLRPPRNPTGNKADQSISETLAPALAAKADAGVAPHNGDDGLENSSPKPVSVPVPKADATADGPLDVQTITGVSDNKS